MIVGRLGLARTSCTESPPSVNAHGMAAAERMVGVMPAATKRTSTREDITPRKVVLSDDNIDFSIRSDTRYLIALSGPQSDLNRDPLPTEHG